MGSNYNNTEGQHSDEDVIMDTETAYLQKRVQKVRPRQEDRSLEEMIPSISNHRCGPNSRLTSPSSIRKKIGNHGQEMQSSRSQMNTAEIATSFVSATVKLNSSVGDTSEAINDSGKEYTASPDTAHNEAQEDDRAYKYDNNLAPMIIDTGHDIAIGGRPANYEYKNFAYQDFDPQPRLSKEENTKAFCPSKTPKRSSMTSPLSERRFRALGEKYEILLPGQTKPVERRRSITFDDNVDVNSIEPIRLLSAGGSQSLWYQENEYETIKLKTLALLDRVDHSSGVADGKKYCTRGLEKFMSPEAAEVKKHQAWDAVLNEQFLQRKDGEFDEEILANIYMYSTQRSRKEATRRASLDAEASEAFLKTKFRRHSSFHDHSPPRDFNRRVSF